MKNRLTNLFLVLTLFLTFALPSFAGTLTIKYKQVVTDNYGNELYYKDVTINNPNDLPLGSPWRDYLNMKLNSGKTIYEYASSISSSLSKDFILNLSDEPGTSCSYKDNKGNYCVDLLADVTDCASDSLKKFIFLHEFGHVVMLNSYPSNYTFSVDYGESQSHTLKDIFSNYNTAWIEGWANGFGALNNNGICYNYDLKNSNSTSFLRGNSFDEMTRNELFIARFIYTASTQIEGGQAAIYDVFARTAPHSSLLQFCKNYVSLYPQNQVALAKLLVENSYGNITLKELLTYVNGGSYTVSKELYAYLSAAGLLNNTNTNSNNNNNNTNTTSTKTSFWSRIVTFFKNLFGGKKNTDLASTSSTVKNTSITPTTSSSSSSIKVSSSISDTNSAIAPKELPPEMHGIEKMSVEEAQEEYYKYYSEYTELVKSANPDRDRLMEVRNRMVDAKRRLNRLQGK